MEIRVVTMEDLRQLKMELIEVMKEIFNLKMKNANERLWLKSAEVRQCSRYRQVLFKICASGDYCPIVRSEEAFTITGTISVP